MDQFCAVLLHRTQEKNSLFLEPFSYADHYGSYKKDNGNLEEALTDVRKSYKKERIVLDDSDLIPNPMTGESAEIFEADWIDLEEVQHMELSSIL